MVIIGQTNQKTTHHFQRFTFVIKFSNLKFIFDINSYSFQRYKSKDQVLKHSLCLERFHQ